MTPATEFIWGLRVMERCAAADYIDWAVEMLEKGFDTRDLRILAGLSPKGSVFEAEEYFEKISKELALVEPSKEKAIRLYSIYLAKQIIEKRIGAREGVRRLFSLCANCDYPKYLMIWFELDDACEDIKYGATYSYNYPGLTKENLEETVTKEAAIFIAAMKGAET